MTRYDLTLNIVVHDEKNPENIIFEVTSISRFRFDNLDSFESIPPYFYKNAIAIVFPYLRAFMSTLTLQANTRLIRLNLMNLSNLEQPLKDNTVIL
jgi:preprotein translocase subunit SecB